LRKTGEALKAAYELARNEGAGFMVVHAPTTFRVYHDIAKYDGNPPGDIHGWVLNDLPERFRQRVVTISPHLR